MSYRYYRNSEGYSDPTAGAAIGNVMREQRRREQLTRKAYSNRRKSIRKQHSQQRRETAANQKTPLIPTVAKEAASYER